MTQTIVRKESEDDVSVADVDGEEHKNVGGCGGYLSNHESDVVGGRC